MSLTGQGGTAVANADGTLSAIGIPITSPADGEISLTTGPLTSGSLTSGNATFGPGGSFVQVTYGTGTVTNDIITSAIWASSGRNALALSGTLGSGVSFTLKITGTPFSGSATVSQLTM